LLATFLNMMICTIGQLIIFVALASCHVESMITNSLINFIEVA